MDALKPEKLLDRLGLWKALRGIPGLAAILILSIAIVSLVLAAVPWFRELSRPLTFLATVIGGTILALIGYYLGDFWDHQVFDPLYGRDGHWIGREKRPLGLFPAGADLRRYRSRAIDSVFPPAHSGEGLYREACARAERSPAQWRNIENPLVISKFLRALIWPFALTAVGMFVAALWISFIHDNNVGVPLVIGLLSSLLAALLFVPYIHLRVEHMIRLYQHVSAPRSRRKGE